MNAPLLDIMRHAATRLDLAADRMTGRQASGYRDSAKALREAREKEAEG